MTETTDPDVMAAHLRAVESQMEKMAERVQQLRDRRIDIVAAMIDAPRNIASPSDLARQIVAVLDALESK